MRYLLVLFLLIFSTAKPEIRLEGTVLNQKNGTPIPLVNVYDSYSETGDITDNEGRFSIVLKDQETASIAFSHIAFDSHHQNFDSSQSGLTIKMDETLIQLDDIVITSTRNGYLLRDVPIATEVIGKKRSMNLVQIQSASSCNKELEYLPQQMSMVVLFSICWGLTLGIY